MIGHPKSTFKVLVGSIFLILASCSPENEVYQPIDTSISATEELNLFLMGASDGVGKDFFILPNESDYSKIPQDPLNPITQAKVELGRLLLHETATGGLPKMDQKLGTYACATCHPVGSSFFAGTIQGIGEGGTGFGAAGEERLAGMDGNFPMDSTDIQPIRVPTLVNVAYQEAVLWNGSLGGVGVNADFVDVGNNANEVPENLLGFEGIEVQAMVGQKVHRLKIDEEFVDQFGYREMFDNAFSDIPQNERYSRVTGALAIAAFNRTVLANQSPWQNWLKGENEALTEAQIKGASIFFGKGRCYECHNGPALKSNQFHAFGFADIDFNPSAIILDRTNFENVVVKGRGGFTGRAEDDYKFKVPTLYNLKDSPFLGHGSSFTSIREIVEYKVKGIKQNPRVPNEQLAEQFQSVRLNDEEITQLVDFIENSLYDDDLLRYTPTTILSGNCFPANDEQSQQDLGCSIFN